MSPTTTKEEKKASVATYLSYFQEVINEGIDLGADGNLSAFEMIAMTVAVYYQKCIIDQANEERLEALKKHPPEPEIKKETIEHLATVLQFPPPTKNPT